MKNINPKLNPFVSGKAIDLQIWKKEHEPRLEGEAICLTCKDESMASAPIGTVFMECEKCGTFKKVFKYEIIRDNDHWTCGCGNDLFRITPEGTYCAVCGKRQDLDNE
jgi:hypothetical protein